jgi:hypothetical protein
MITILPLLEGYLYMSCHIPQGCSFENVTTLIEIIKDIKVEDSRSTLEPKKM